MNKKQKTVVERSYRYLVCAVTKSAYRWEHGLGYPCETSTDSMVVNLGLWHLRRLIDLRCSGDECQEAARQALENIRV